MVNGNFDKVNLNATEMINGHEYVVFNVYNDMSLSEVHPVCDNNFYVKLVLQEDYIREEGSIVYWGTTAAYAQAKIIDLNGYSIIVPRFDTNARYLEIWDSSVAQTGKIVCTEVLNLQGWNMECNLRGGTLQATVVNYVGVSLSFHGGQVEFEQANNAIKFNVPPYMVATYDENGHVLTAKLKAGYFAVSSSKLISGAYNTVYGYQWDLTAKACSNLILPTDKTYYLWERNADGWYEFLDYCCTDGKTWQST